MANTVVTKRGLYGAKDASPTPISERGMGVKMPLSVRDALRVGPLRRSKVIAGHQGLDRTIESVTIMDTPDICKWLKGGELLLANVYVIRDNPLAQVALIKDLHDRKVAALGVKVGRFVDRLPQEMLDLANQLNLPVIQMPIECSWAEVINPVLTQVLDSHAARLQESNRIHDYFTGVALSGNGLDAICHGVTSLTSLPCAVLDRSRRVLSAVPSHGVVQWDEVVRVLMGMDVAEMGTRPSVVALSDGGMLVLRLSVGSYHYGYIVAAGRLTENLATASVALEHAGTVTMLELAKRKAILETERRFRNDFLMDLLRGKVDDRNVALSRAMSLGNWDFRKPRAIVVMGIDGFEDYYLRNRAANAAKIQGLRDQFIDVLSTGARAQCPGTITVEQSDGVVLLIPTDRGTSCLSSVDGIKSLVMELKSYVQKIIKEVTVSAGIGRLHTDVMEWAKAYHEADQAIDYGRRLWGNAQVVHYSELGTFRIILGNSNWQEMIQFSNEVFRGLGDCKPEQREEILQTLNAFFRNNRRIGPTAEALFLHTNTVRHRLKRIGEILGFDPDSAEDCLSVEIAQRIRMCAKNRRDQSQVNSE